MALNKQIKLYAIDTAFFYNEEESKVHKKMNRLYIYRKKLEKLKKKSKDDTFKDKMTVKIKRTNKKLKTLKGKLIATFKLNRNTRVLKSGMLRDKKIVAMFDSSLTRANELEQDQLTEDIFIIKTYFFTVLEDIILNGFIYNDEKYVCFTASAGQIRTKKTLFVKESVLNDLLPNLMCGLTMEIINECGGININKYLAYLALCSSATDRWDNFDITKSIVVDDMETKVRGIVDFIDDETYKITRKEMDVPIAHTDGAGMILPSKSKKNFMVRLPWMKGLLISFPFDKFIREKKCSGIIKDIYGVEHDVIKEGIEVIFTKSQFKMYAYYKSWEQYKENFVKYGCEASVCNVEEDYFRDAKLNYQMLQTLTDMTDKEIKTVAQRTNDNIKNIGSDKQTMFRVLGLTRGNTNKTYFGKSVEKYHPILRDSYTKEVLREIKKSMVKGGYAGKLDIDGKYTFISPDLYAFCEFLFLGDKTPEGLLDDGEVYCSLYKDANKLDCLRSPHCYREHAIRNNVVDKETSKWFTTNALYVSSHDLISKLIMCDWDGDKSLVVADKTIIEVAERNMKDIVPLYYNMAKAGKMDLSHQNIYDGLKTAYSGGNIGIKSNDITKVLNGDVVDESALEVVKLLTAETNFVVDYAKTLYKPDRPESKNELIRNYTKSKLPHFFVYSNDKLSHQVKPINNSTVNKLKKIIKNPRIDFEEIGIGEFDYTNLMFDVNVDADSEDAVSLIKLYKKLDLGQHFILSGYDDEKSGFEIAYDNVRRQILECYPNVNWVTDVLVKYLYSVVDSRFKNTLWNCFGDIIYENISRNVKTQYTYCEVCGDIIEKSGRRDKYCADCQKVKEKEKTRERVRKYREIKKCNGL